MTHRCSLPNCGPCLALCDGRRLGPIVHSDDSVTCVDCRCKIVDQVQSSSYGAKVIEAELRTPPGRLGGTGRGGMTHRIRGGFSEHPQALCGDPEPETVVDSDDAVTCWRCRAKSCDRA